MLLIPALSAAGMALRCLFVDAGERIEHLSGVRQVDLHEARAALAGAVQVHDLVPVTLQRADHRSSELS